MIHGLQHIGIGFRDLDRAWDFYRDILHFDVPLSRSRRVADRMGSLTGGPQERRVIIALNLLGGGLVEIFQFLSKEPKPAEPLSMTDTGVLSVSCKVTDIEMAFDELKGKGVRILAEPYSLAGSSIRQMFIEDTEGNLVGLVEMPGLNYSVKVKNASIGGFLFPTIGVSDMEKSLKFYRDLLGYDTVVYDKKGKFEELAVLPDGELTMRRVILKRGRPSTSLFSFYLDGGMIELIEAETEGKRKHRFRGRGWGDQGIMEVCLDVSDIGDTYRELTGKGARPVIEANEDRFDMGEGSSALFGYVADPDGTWIELAEIVSFPIWGSLSFDLSKRKKNKPLSSFVLKLLRFARSKS